MPRYSSYEYDRYDAIADADADALEERLDELREEYPDADDEELYDIIRDEDADRCGCSDPGCPCEGLKRGGSP
jgi:hypothetical protein